MKKIHIRDPFIKLNLLALSGLSESDGRLLYNGKPVANESDPTDSDIVICNNFSDLPSDAKDGTLGYVLNDSTATTDASKPDLSMIPHDEEVESIIEQEYISQGGELYDEGWVDFQNNYTNCNFHNITYAEPNYNPELLYMFDESIDIGMNYSGDKIAEIRPVGILVGSDADIGEGMGFVAESQYKYFPTISFIDWISETEVDGQILKKITLVHGYAFEPVTGHLLNSELDDETVFTIEKGWFECYALLSDEGEPIALKIEPTDPITIPSVEYAECDCDTNHIDELKAAVSDFLLVTEKEEIPKGLYISVGGKWIKSL